MSQLIRFGVSIDSQILQPFDELIEREGYTNRSKAIADLIQERLLREREETPNEMAGTLTMVYDHHARGLESKLTQIQHEHVAMVVSTLHVHLDAEFCLQVLVLRGPARALRILGGKLKALRGVRHTTLSLTAAGSPSHSHTHPHRH